MKNKDLNIFVYDKIITFDSIIKAIKRFIKKVIIFFKKIILILPKTVEGFIIDVNSPPYYDNIFSPLLIFSKNYHKVNL